MCMRVFNDPAFPVAHSMERSAAGRKAEYVLCATERRGNRRQVRVEAVKWLGVFAEVQLDRSEGKGAIVVCRCRHKGPVQ